MCMQQSTQESSKISRQIWPFGVLTGGSALLPPLGSLAVLGTLDVVGPWLAAEPLRGVVLYILAFIVLAGLALLPTYAQAILGGWAFGFAIGFPAAMAGFLGAALLAHVLVSRVSPGVTEAIESRPRWRAIHRAFVGHGFWRTTALVALVRLPPTMPFAMTNVVMAGTGVGRGPYLLGTALGMTPRVALAVFAAAGVQRWRDIETPGGWTWLAGLAATVLAAAVLVWVGRRALRSVTAPAEPA